MDFLAQVGEVVVPRTELPQGGVSLRLPVIEEVLNLSTDTQSVEIPLSGATVKEAVETDADRDMVPAETGKTDTGIYVMANANSIVSVRLAL